MYECNCLDDFEGSGVMRGELELGKETSIRLERIGDFGLTIDAAILLAPLNMESLLVNSLRFYEQRGNIPWNNMGN